MWSKSITDPGELSLEEQRIMDAFLWSVVENWLNTYRLSNQRLVDVDWRARVGDESIYFFGNPYARGWWDNWRSDNSNSVPEELEQLIENRLESNPDYTTGYYAAVAKNVEERIQSKRR